MDREVETTDEGQVRLVVRTWSPVSADRDPVKVYLARLGKGTRRTMATALETIARILSGGRTGADALPWPELRYQHTQAVRTALAERYKHGTANKMLSALRGVLKECWRLGYMSAEDYRRATDIGPVRGETLLSGRALTQGELRALFETCAADSSPAAIRDAALLAVLYGAGLRRSEAISLMLTDYDAETGAIKIRAGKGNKDRVVYAENGAAEAMGCWLNVRGPTEGPLFCRTIKGGGVEVKAISSQAVYTALQRRAKQAGVREFSPHDLRRTMISDLLDAGADVSAVRQLAGHASVTTTARYDRRGERAKKKAAGLLNVPFVRVNRQVDYVVAPEPLRRREDALS